MPRVIELLVAFNISSYTATQQKSPNSWHAVQGFRPSSGLRLHHIILVSFEAGKGIDHEVEPPRVLPMKERGGFRVAAIHMGLNWAWYCKVLGGVCAFRTPSRGTPCSSPFSR